jgi:hypothetical protein
MCLADYLDKFGNTSHDAGDYRNAERPLARALAIREQALGPQHPDVARSLNKFWPRATLRKAKITFLRAAEGSLSSSRPCKTFVSLGGKVA